MLTAISSPVLGHVAMQPWTMYGLAHPMRRNVHYFFPRAESQVYAEPKRLVAAGLATASTEMNGHRKRTIYSITPEGQAELERWLAEPIGKRPLLEFEGLLRVFLAPFGTEQDLTATVAQIKSEITDLLEMADRIRTEYLEERAPFQRYVLTRSMVYDFLDSFAVLVDEWAARSIERLDAWPREDDASRTEAALDIFRARDPRSRDS